jgi:hypothetical protein
MTSLKMDKHPAWRGGKTYHPLYWTHRSMLLRCADLNNPYYGGRGITVCERWSGEDGFWNFVTDMGERPPDCTLDRIDSDGHYTTDNCRWATDEQQIANRRPSAARTFIINYLVTHGGEAPAAEVTNAGRKEGFTSAKLCSARADGSGVTSTKQGRWSVWSYKGS